MSRDSSFGSRNMKQLFTLCMKSESQKKWGMEFFFLFLFIPWPQPMWQWQLHPVSIFLPHRYIQRNVSSQVNNKDWPSQVDTNAFIYWKKSKIQNLCRSEPWNLDFYFFTHPSIIFILHRIKYSPMHTNIELREERTDEQKNEPERAWTMKARVRARAPGAK